MYTDIMDEEYPDDEENEPLPVQKRQKTVSPRQKTIDLISKWVRKMGIKSKSRYVLKMDTLLADNLNQDWDNVHPKQLADDII